MTKRVRWGILGTATIAREAVIPALRTPPYGEHLELVAIASRQVERARAVAEAFAIDRAYGSYEALLADADIDAVYIPLPNHLHVPYSIRALEAGKHVLCEKPIALSADEAQQLVDAAGRQPQLKLMEAFMYRLHPQWQWLRRIVEDGRIGQVGTVHSFFSFYDDDPASILHHPEWGGGGLMDIGCYCVSLSRFVFRAEPLRVLGTLEQDPQFGVDRLAAGLLQFAGGVATFTCSTRVAPCQRVEVFGSRGRAELLVPFTPPTDQQSRARLEVDDSSEEVRFPICDHYGIQADLFSRAILDDTAVPTPIADALANMQVLDALVRSSASNTWETP